MNRIKVVLLFIIILSSFLVCSGNIKFDIKPNKEYNYSEVVDADGVDEVRIKCRSGYIKVVGGKEKIAVSATIWSPKELTEEEVNRAISIDRDGEVVVITILEDDWDIIGLNSVDFMVEVPSSVSLDLLTKSGDINISGVDGGYVLQTDNGDVTIANVGGEGEATTLNGDIIAEGEADSLELQTSNGDIKVEGFEELNADTNMGDIEVNNCDEVDVNTSNGDILLKNVKTFTALTSFGDVVIDTGDVSGSSEVKTDNGNLKLTLRTFKRILADFPETGDLLLSGLDVSPAESERMKTADEVILWSGGEGEIQLSTSNGDISIVKVNE